MDLETRLMNRDKLRVILRFGRYTLEGKSQQRLSRRRQDDVSKLFFPYVWILDLIELDTKQSKKERIMQMRHNVC